MARPPKGSPIEGGYFITGAKRLLNDTKLIESGLRGEFWACLAVCQLVNPWEGRYEFNGMAVTRDMIIKRASITNDQFNDLLNLGFIKEDKQGIFYVPKWVDYQSPQTKSLAKQRENNDSFNKSLNDSNNESSNLEQSVIINPKSVIINPNHSSNNNQGNGGSNQMPEGVKVRMKQISEYHQMLQNPKYGTDQCAEFKAQIKLLELQIDDINKRNGHKTPIGLDF